MSPARTRNAVDRWGATPQGWNSSGPSSPKPPPPADPHDAFSVNTPPLLVHSNTTLVGTAAGAASSSRMVAVAVGLASRFAFDGFDSVKANVSSDSSAESSMTVTDTIAVVLLAGMVTVRAVTEA